MGHRYLQMDVETSSREALVSRLLGAALKNTRSVSEAGKPGDVVSRNRSLSRAVDIVAELRSGLDFEKGGEIASNLDALYEFVSARLLEASTADDDRAARDALTILEAIARTWEEALESLQRSRA